MRIVKVLSIIGFIWFIACLFCAAYLVTINQEGEAAGFAFWATIYGIPYSLVTFYLAKKQK